MPVEPLQVNLTDGEKVEVLKRFQHKYHEEMEELESKLTELLRMHAEADFLVQYLGEQPEVVELKSHQEEIAKLEQRRQHIGAILERLTQVIPQQADVTMKAPSQMRRY